MISKVALLTAGLTAGDISKAAERITGSAKSLFKFDHVIRLDSNNLKSLCPDVNRRYSRFLNDRVKGYGYWAWKPELIYRTLRGDYGKVDQIVWVDAGCEINSNGLSRTIFRRRIHTAHQTGHWFHCLKNTDSEYSKGYLIAQFPGLRKESLEKPQFQANYLHLQGKLGLEIAEEWFKRTLVGIMNLDDELSGESESAKFIGHKSDQSILSLVCKARGIETGRINLPSGYTFSSKIKGLVEPIWIARNRTGVSMIPSILKELP